MIDSARHGGLRIVGRPYPAMAARIKALLLRFSARKSIASAQPIGDKLDGDDLHPSTAQRAPRIRSRRAASQLQTGRARAARDARRRGAAGESAGGAPRRTPVRAAA